MAATRKAPWATCWVALIVQGMPTASSLRSQAQQVSGHAAENFSGADSDIEDIDLGDFPDIEEADFGSGAAKQARGRSGPGPRKAHGRDGPGSLLHKLLATDGAARQYFGMKLVANSDGTRFLVAAHGDGDLGHRAGAAYLFDGSGNQLLKLLAPDGVAYQQFGNIVAMTPDATRLLVGACGWWGRVQGSAYLFDASGMQLRKLVVNDGTGDTFFGMGVAMNRDGTLLAVGGHGFDDQAGAVYLFDDSESEPHKLLASDRAAGDHFGHRVSMSSDGMRVAVAAMGTGSNTGAVYLFDGAGNQLLKLLANDGAAGDLLGMGGMAMNFDGSRILVGASHHSASSGSAYLFDGSSGNQLLQLLATDGAAGDLFGISVSMSSDATRLAVGAVSDDDLGANSGSAYLFDESGNQLLKLLADDGVANDQFACAVALSSDGTRLLVGDREDSHRGSAYLFDVSTPSPTSSPAPSPTATPAPTAATPSAGWAGAGASAVGDPHLQNIHGERFDLMKAGKHVLINIPRGTSASAALLRVQADARRLGGQCADMYFQELNVTGSWAEAKQAGGYHYSVTQHTAKSSEWVSFGKVELKVVHGRTDSGLLYLNLYVKHLGRAGFAVGGLLGEDDHGDVSAAPDSCAQRLALVAGTRGGEGQALSFALASLA